MADLRDERFVCSDCGVLSPDTRLDDASTLLSTKFGWRIRRRIDADGASHVEARCAVCHAKTRGAAPLRTPTASKAIAHPDAGEQAQAAPAARCTTVRRTVLLSSLRALRERGHIEAYGGVAPRLVERIAAAVDPWLPIALAEDHYAACDLLDLPEEEILVLGAAVAPVQAAGVRVMFSAARAAGASVWTPLRNVPRYWTRMYNGSGVRVVERGPKDALVIIESNPLARYRYWRLALRGVIENLTRELASAAVVREMRRRDSPADMASYAISWV
ncbi:MAG TPA: hypothetical protein VGI39_30370 [Polyangiaceae bacterium]